MGLGPRSGSRTTRRWFPRLLLLAVLAGLALFAHGHGTHSGTRTASYLAIFGLLLLRFVARTRRRPGSMRNPGAGQSTGARFGSGGPFWGAGTTSRGGPFPQAGPNAGAPRTADRDVRATGPAAHWPPPSPGVKPVDSPIAGPPLQDP